MSPDSFRSAILGLLSGRPSTSRFNWAAASIGICNSFASLMLLKGVHPKIVSHILGHASVGFTLDVYSHIISGMEEDALKVYDEVLPEGIIQSFNTKIRHEFSDSRS